LQLVSVISLLSADPPATDSPANVDAAKQVREDIVGYRKQVRAACMACDVDLSAHT
jgi:ubiquitin-conjugating enzyme E2 G1